jgi:hypothetical protein
MTDVKQVSLRDDESLSGGSYILLYKYDSYNLEDRIKYTWLFSLNNKTGSDIKMYKSLSEVLELRDALDVTIKAYYEDIQPSKEKAIPLEEENPVPDKEEPETPVKDMNKNICISFARLVLKQMAADKDIKLKYQ